MDRRTFITSTTAAAIGLGTNAICFKEGVPRLLDMWDQVGVKVTSHMVGQAVERHPELAKEIVDRGP